MSAGTFKSESEFRAAVKKVLDPVESCFDQIDPDVAECFSQMGALTIQFSDRSKCILSSQPSVQQIWLALAAKGIAYHFDYSLEKYQWIEDKTKCLELTQVLKSFLIEKGVDTHVLKF